MVVESVAKMFKVRFRRNVYCKAHLAKRDEVVLSKPYTFMNLSGFSVRRILDSSSASYKDILVVCDDLNLSLGTIRLRAKGSPGGHKGLASIIESLHTQDFPRLRIGIGRPHDPADDASRFVLSGFLEGEVSIIEKAVHQARDCVVAWLREDIRKVMSKFN